MKTEEDNNFFKQLSVSLNMPEPIPQHVHVKPSFEEHYRTILGKEYDLFMKYSLSYIRKAIRVNTLKTSVANIQKKLAERWELTPIPWCKEGFWIAFKKGKRFDIGNLKEHLLGYLYVQEAASMIPPVVLQPRPHSTVLDMCSSPGSKATQMSALMHNTGILVCNDLTGERIKPLGLNLQRGGCTNTLTTRMNGEAIKQAFDHVLVDAPCSGVGTIRKSLKILKMWSPGLVEKMARIQKRLVRRAYLNLKPGGTMVYSTCTLEPAENEGVVQFLLDQFPDAQLREITLPLKRAQPFTEINGQPLSPQIQKCLRIHPYHNDTEGFFVAHIQKPTSE